MASVVGRDTTAFTVHWPPAVAGNGVRGIWVGVVDVVPLETLSVVLVSVQVAVQLP